MHEYKNKFIKLSLKAQALCFGEFTLKSGRRSPYFFNSGKFNTGKALDILGSCYASKIIESNIEYDMLFGPAYKGIPLVAATATALTREYGVEVPFAFNRKENKGHGEGGKTVGAALRGNVLIIDDVITAGTAISESIKILNVHEATPVGVVIGLDRCETNEDGLSTTKLFASKTKIPVLSIINIFDILDFLSLTNELVKEIKVEQLEVLGTYVKNYCN